MPEQVRHDGWKELQFCRHRCFRIRHETDGKYQNDELQTLAAMVDRKPDPA